MVNFFDTFLDFVAHKEQAEHPKKSDEDAQLALLSSRRLNQLHVQLFKVLLLQQICVKHDITVLVEFLHFLLDLLFLCSLHNLNELGPCKSLQRRGDCRLYENAKDELRKLNRHQRKAVVSDYYRNRCKSDEQAIFQGLPSD